MQQGQRAEDEERPKNTPPFQDGIALLIAIFVLLLISVVAIALLVSSGTETALGANYRTSSTVYYAAIAGLEEARGRLLPKNPNYFGRFASFPDVPTFPLGQTRLRHKSLAGRNHCFPGTTSNPITTMNTGLKFGPDGVQRVLAVRQFGLGQQYSGHSGADLQVGPYQRRDRAVSLLAGERQRLL